MFNHIKDIQSNNNDILSLFNVDSPKVTNTSILISKESDDYNINPFDNYYVEDLNSFNFENALASNCIEKSNNDCKNQIQSDKKSTINSLSYEENKELSEKIFVTKKISKKPKNSLSSHRRVHKGNAIDNIVRKIHVAFLTFIVNFTNDIIRSTIKRKNVPIFKHFDYKLKKIANLQKIADFKSKKIGEILQFRVSTKMKINGESVNKKIYLKICEICPSFKQFFEIRYLDLFEVYFNNNNKIYEYKGESFLLSQRTKTFADLMNKYKLYQDKLKYIAINYFLKYHKRIKKKLFKTSIITK